MYPIFNAFKRHYRKVKKVFKPMTESGSFAFHANYVKDQGAAVSLDTPDADLTVRFVALMRRFLDRNDPLYFESVWQHIEEGFGAEIPTEAREQYQQLSHALLTQSDIEIVHNGEKLTPERIYHMLSEGEYFNHDEQAQAFLMSVRNIPMLGELFWFEFYNYSVGGLVIASLIFDMIQVIEQTDAYKNKYVDLDEASRKCIFCLTTTGSFKSEEHILPESLASAEWLLPKGYVCDTCNNGILAQLDSALANSALFAHQRVQYLAYDKEGRFPEVRLGAITLKRTGPLNILMRSELDSDGVKIEEEFEDGWVRFSFHETFKQGLDERRLARALCKIALELLASDHNQDYVCNERFNAVRSFIRTGSDFHNNLLIRSTFAPEPRISVTLIPVAEGLLAEFHIYGVIFVLSLEEQPFLELTDVGRESGFVSFPLYGDPVGQEFTLEMVPDPAIYNAIPERYRPKPSASVDASETEQGTSTIPNTAPDDHASADAT